MFDSNKPYNELGALPPKGEIDTKDVLVACNLASRSLAELKGFVETLPDQRIILDLLPLQESRSSNEIENIVSTRDRIFIAATNDKSDDMLSREIIRYREVLIKNKNTVLDKKGIMHICSDICGEKMGYRTLKEDEVFLSSFSGIKYTPPSGNHVGKLMDNLVEYIYNDDLDPLIKMAVIHYQFESIHPFFDGNGRTGRMINILYLQYNHLLDNPILFLSKYLIDNKKKYYALLESVTTDNNWEEWIIFILDAVRISADETIKLIKDILKLENTMKKIFEDNNVPNNYLHAIMAHPIFTESKIEKETGFGRNTVRKYISVIETNGIVTKKKIGKSHYYFFDDLLQLFKK